MVFNKIDLLTIYQKPILATTNSEKQLPNKSPTFSEYLKGQ